MSAGLAIFDCDGTLVDGQAAICTAMERAFASAGMPAPARHDIRRIVGLSLPQAVRRLAPDADEGRQHIAVEGYKQAYRTAREQAELEEPLYPGMADLLGRLRDDGWLLGVATGKSTRGLDACLAHHGIADLFVTLQTADGHPSKPDPTMLHTAIAEAQAHADEPIQRIVMIGDTVFDIAMAGAARVEAIGVNWGYHTAEEMLAEGAVSVADTMEELEAMIRA